MAIRSNCDPPVQRGAGLHRRVEPRHGAEVNRLTAAYRKELLGLSAERALAPRFRDLESKLCSECDRTVSKVVQILTEVRAIQIINRNSVIILIESIQEIGAHDELAHLVELDVL
jgi:hypothetical protein